MGWNTLDVKRAHPLLDGIKTGPDGLHAYFVHSFQLYADNPGDVVATADYGGPVTAIVARDNVVGTQFHPEKSQTLGLSADRQFPEVAPVILFPAIDLKNGECVRLLRGDMAQATVFNSRPRGAGADVRRARVRISPCRRSRRRLRRDSRSTPRRSSGFSPGSR